MIAGLVSTIIPVYNRPDMLRQAVASVLAQTWPSIEVLIADDGSTDSTRQVGEELEALHPGVVSYRWNTNGGAGVAREHGRMRARGEFIQYLDSDDLLWPRKFEVQIAALRAAPECGAAYGWIRLCPEGGTPVERPHKWSGRAINTLFPAMLQDRWWNTDAPLWRRSTCDAIGPWSDLRFSQDWEYDARAGALGTRLAFCPEFVCDQRHHFNDRQTGDGRWLAPADRVRFFSSLLESARRGGVALETPEMRHFSRWAFAHARQCGSMGDAESAQRLIDLAASAAGGMSFEMRAYKAAARSFGWNGATRLGDIALRLLGRSVSGSTLKQSWME